MILQIQFVTPLKTKGIRSHAFASSGKQDPLDIPTHLVVRILPLRIVDVIPFGRPADVFQPLIDDCIFRFSYDVVVSLKELSGICSFQCFQKRLRLDIIESISQIFIVQIFGCLRFVVHLNVIEIQQIV